MKTEETRYNYYAAVTDAVYEQLHGRVDAQKVDSMNAFEREHYADCLWNELMLSEIYSTGISEDEAWNNLEGNLPLLDDALNDCDAVPYGEEPLLSGAKACDEAIRVHLLRGAIEITLDDLVTEDYEKRTADSDPDDEAYFRHCAEFYGF